MQAEIISFVALLIALASTVVNYVLLRAQRDPEIVVYASHDTKRPSIINLIIENIGNGIARDISFKADRSIPAEAFGIENAKVPEQMKKGPLIYGIPFLHPGERRLITWGQYDGLCKGLDDKAIDISTTYFSNPSLKIVRQKHTTISRIDIKSFEGTDASDYNWDKKSAEQLQKIAASLKVITDTRNQSLRITVSNDSQESQ